jgi:hypothetical protein
MRIRRRSLRKLLIAVGCVVATVSWPGAALGGVAIVAGCGLHLWSKGCLEQNRRLTTAGPYRWTRNPFYLANLMIDVGLCFVIGRWWIALVFLPIWFVSYRRTIAREEARLLGLFPESLPDYLAAVPALIPTGRHLPSHLAQGAFRWDNDSLARGSEFARLFGVVLAPLAIWAAEGVRLHRSRLFADENAFGLALVVFLGVGWILKLALAETFRRPDTALLPAPLGPTLRVAGGASFIVLAALSGLPWMAALPATWIGLVALDRYGSFRIAADGRAKGALWSYLPWIVAGTLAVSASLCLLAHLFDG